MLFREVRFNSCVRWPFFAIFTKTYAGSFLRVVRLWFDVRWIDMIVKNVLNTYIMGIGWFPVPLHVFEVDTRENFDGEVNFESFLKKSKFWIFKKMRFLKVKFFFDDFLREEKSKFVLCEKNRTKIKKSIFWRFFIIFLAIFDSIEKGNRQKFMYFDVKIANITFMLTPKLQKWLDWSGSNFIRRRWSQGYL